ncbi:MAG TPA: hypothetical protein VKE26_22440 [Xanthobacteraceae bacterium]|nr:hypothetical protein [Xanthobacteraceae bacterium]
MRKLEWASVAGVTQIAEAALLHHCGRGMPALDEVIGASLREMA